MAILAARAGEAGVVLTPQQLDQFEVYYQQLAQWNRRVNLTAITGYHEVQVKHFLDSLTACLAAPEGFSSATRVIDIGAGAGLPGLPLKLAFPEIHLVLLESVAKKAAFLEHLAADLELAGVEICTGRAETFGHQADLRETFDLALTRGLARLPVLLEYSLPFCRLGGRVVAFKHGDLDAELARAGGAIEALGGRLSPVVPVEVSGLTDNRVLVVVDKIAATPDRYPRRPGMPAKRPL